MTIEQKTPESQDTPMKAVIASLKSQSACHRMLPHEIEAIANSIVAGLRNAGHIKESG